MTKQEEIVNCQTCGTGKNWWIRRLWFFSFRCPCCGGNPLKGNGRIDWEEFNRAKMVSRFGPRAEGDMELLEHYREELW